MPANAVGPGDEYTWRRAKAKARALGHGDDWGYIMTLFQRMKKSLEKGFVIPQRYTFYRTPGQVPDSARLPKELKRMVGAPLPLTENRLQRYDDRPVLRPEAVVAGLGLSAELASAWAHFAGEVSRSAANEMTVRQMVLERCRADQITVEASKAILQRSLAYWRQVQKSFVRVEVSTADELAKGEARGGKYHRRVPKPGGGFRYVYDEASYQRRPDAHVDGEGASLAYATSQVVKCVQGAGEGGCRASALKPLVQKFGSKKISKILEGGAGGKITFKGGKFRLNSKPEKAAKKAGNNA